MRRRWVAIFAIINLLNQVLPNEKASDEEIDRVANSYLTVCAHNEVLRLEHSTVRSYHNFRQVVEQSLLLKMINKMPKGTNSHGYLYGLVSYEYIYNLTWTPNLMACTNQFGIFRFSYTYRYGFQCTLVEVLRRGHNMDEYIQQQLMITEEQALKPTESIILTKYKSVESLVSKKSALQSFIFRMLFEQVQDGISYVVFRSSLRFYDSETDLEYSALDVMEIYKEVIDYFTRLTPNFIGAKVIFSPYGTELYNNPKGSIDIVRKVAAVYPKLMIGIEFFVPVNSDLLLTLPRTVEVYYHHAKRIHMEDFNATVFTPSTGVSISEKEILNDQLLDRRRPDNKDSHTKVIEVCPNSVYFQTFKEDLRNVVANYIAAGHRILICSEYPGFWHIKSLSHDWYLVLLYMVKGQKIIDFFKQISVNSFVYSSGLDTVDKMMAINTLNNQWNQYKKLLYDSPPSAFYGV